MREIREGDNFLLTVLISVVLVLVLWAGWDMASAKYKPEIAKLKNELALLRSNK
jgi:hypothetical protein